MPFNGTGTFFRIHNFEADRAALIPVTSVRVDAELNGIADALSNCLTRDGQSAPSGPITFPSGGLFADGTYIAPSITFINEPDVGLFRDGVDNLGIAARGQHLANFHPDEIKLQALKLSLLKNVNGSLQFAVKNADMSSTSVVAKLDFQAGTTLGYIMLQHDDGTGNVGSMYFGSTSNSPLRFIANNVQAMAIHGDRVVPYFPIQAVASPPDPAKPVFSFNGDADTGIYRPADNTIGFSIGGVLRYSMGPASFTSNQQILVSTGVMATPSYSFVGETGTGIWKQAAGVIQLVSNGVAMATFGPGSAGLVGNLSLTGTLSAAGGVVITAGGLTITGDLSVSGSLTSNLRAPAGSAAAPGISFSGDPDTGIWNSGTNTMNFVCGTASPMSVSASVVSIAVPLRTNGYFFLNDPDSGFQALDANGNIAVVNNSAQTALFAATHAAFGVPVQISDGVPGSNAGLGFMAEPTLGISRLAAKTMSLNVGGLDMLRVDGTTGSEHVLTRYQLLAGAGMSGGTQVRPAVAVGDTNTGLYRNGPGIMGISAAGTGVAFFGATSVIIGPQFLVAGTPATLAAPNIAFYTDENTGFLHDLDNTIKVVCNGVLKATFDPAGAKIPSVDGVLATPGMSFQSEPGLGIYRSSPGTLAIAAAGTGAAFFTASAVVIGTQLVVAGGASTLASPDIVFYGDENTGLLNDTPDTFKAVCGGLHSATFAQGAVLFGDGSVAAPGLSFINDPDNGLYRAATNLWRLVAGGKPMLGIDGVNDKLLAYYGVINMAAAAPPTPQDGDFWSNGSAVFIRLGGVTKVFTLT